MEAVDVGMEPILNQIVFEFVEDTTKDRFNQRTDSGLIVVDSNDKQLESSRWVRILAIGPDVEYAEPGQIVLIGNLRWTNQFKSPSDQYVWISTEEEIMAEWDDLDNLPVN